MGRGSGIGDRPPGGGLGVIRGPDCQIFSFSVGDGSGGKSESDFVGTVDHAEDAILSGIDSAFGSPLVP